MKPKVRRHGRCIDRKSPKAKAVRDGLPKTFRGADVVRGLGMKETELEKFVERKAMDVFDATRDIWIVIEERALEDIENSVEVHAFASKADAIRYAQARSRGNIDHRVLRVTEQTLVVATYNDL